MPFRSFAHISLSEWAAIIAAVILLVQIFLLRIQMKSQHEWNRRATAMSTMTFLTDKDFRAMRERMDKHLAIKTRHSSEISLEEISTAANGDYPEIHGDIETLLNALEIMAVAIRHKVADDTICRAIGLAIVVNNYRNFKQFVEDKRRIRQDYKIYENLEWLVDDWTRKKDSRDRSPTG